MILKIEKDEGYVYIDKIESIEVGPDCTVSNWLDSESGKKSRWFYKSITDVNDHMKLLEVKRFVDSDNLKEESYFIDRCYLLNDNGKTIEVIKSIDEKIPRRFVEFSDKEVRDAVRLLCVTYNLVGGSDGNTNLYDALFAERQRGLNNIKKCKELEKDL